jgi:hypothetical protein
MLGVADAVDAGTRDAIMASAKAATAMRAVSFLTTALPPQGISC